MNDCWLDFWTSNSSIWTTKEWEIKLANFNEASFEPTSLFFDQWNGSYIFWKEAINYYHDPSKKWRLMISLKRWLWRDIKTILEYHDPFSNSKKKEVVTLLQLCSKYIAYMKENAEKQFWKTLESIIIWRPVKFHDTDISKDESAQNELQNAAKLAWFKNIEFLQEPVWWIYGSLHKINLNTNQEKNILIADIWWWTSDFSIAKILKKSWKDNIDVQILSNDWIYLWWDEITAQIIRKSVSEMLGKKATYLSMPEKELLVPSAPFTHLNYWNQINNLSQNKVKNIIWNTLPRIIGDDQKIKYQRLKEISENTDIWHKMHSTVNNVKIQLSWVSQYAEQFDMFTNQFEYNITISEFNEIIKDTTSRIIACMNESIIAAGITPWEIDNTIFIWWTTNIPYLRDQISLQTKWKIIHWDTFTAVATWLSKYSSMIYR